MDESIEKVLKVKKPKKQIIRISKIFSKNKNPQNILVINKGKEKIEYNLTHKISKKFILEALKTIQKNSVNSNNNNQIYHTTNIFQYQYKIVERNKEEDKNNSDKKNKSSQYLHKLVLKELNIIKKNINSKENIYFAKLTDINKKNKSNKASQLKIKSFNGLGVLENEKINNNLMNEENLDINNGNFNNLINTYKYIDINDASTERNKKNSSSRKIIFNNDQNIIKFNQDKNINIHTMPKLINLQDNNNISYKKEKINNVINTDFKYNNNETKECIICEMNFSLSKLYSAKCNIHLFCKECLRVYYQNLIDKGIKRMKCPIFKCNYDINKNILGKILDKSYYLILFDEDGYDEDKRTILDERHHIKGDNINSKQQFEKPYKNINIYHKKNVLQINSDFSLSNIKKYEGEYCLKCHEKSLFCLTCSFFNKCLNCGYKCCKYCNKEYTNMHLTLNDPRHCKVFYRKNKEFFKNNKSKCSSFIFQILYVIGIYILFLSYIFIIISNFFYWLFRIEKAKNNNSSLYPLFMKYFISYFLCILIYLIILPFLVVMIHFFPTFLLMLDGFN